jgi:hypothetical protein
MTDFIEFCLRGETNTSSHQDFTTQSRLSYRRLSEIAEVDAIAPCPKCGGTRINIVKMPEGCAHYAARRCGQCDRFLGWAPKPESQQKRQQMQTTINQMLQSPQLSPWEREFLENMRSRRSLSPKQQEIVSRIEVEVGGQG